MKRDNAGTLSFVQTAIAAQQALRKTADPDKAVFLQRFFKTAPGQYGYGDVFIGVTVPNTRMVARLFPALPRTELTSLLHSKTHEDRLLALLILTIQFSKGDQATRKTLYNYYLRNRRYVNNWDLVDTSAPHIVGAYLFEHTTDRWILDDLIVSTRLWDRRIAMIATQYFIRQNELTPTFRLAERLLDDPEDLMHKASGWMLREAGKKDVQLLKRFLDRYQERMPRTMLRYAIERLPEKERRRYLK